jgi:hypothetical protein
MARTLLNLSLCAAPGKSVFNITLWRPRSQVCKPMPSKRMAARLGKLWEDEELWFYHLPYRKPMALVHILSRKLTLCALMAAALTACGGGETAGVAQQEAAFALQASDASTTADVAAPSYCTSGSDDAELMAFRKQLARALRAFPTTYSINVCAYRESQAFVGGSAGSLVATLDAENSQNLATQPHPASTSVQCAASGDLPCVRTRQVQLLMPGTHPEAVRQPSDPANPMARVVAIVRDADTSGAQ